MRGKTLTPVPFGTGETSKKVDFLISIAYTIDARSNFCSEQALEVVVIEETVTASVKVDIYISEADNRQKNLHPVPFGTEIFIDDRKKSKKD